MGGFQPFTIFFSIGKILGLWQKAVPDWIYMNLFIFFIYFLSDMHYNEVVLI